MGASAPKSGLSKIRITLTTRLYRLRGKEMYALLRSFLVLSCTLSLTDESEKLVVRLSSEETVATSLSRKNSLGVGRKVVVRSIMLVAESRREPK